LVPSRDTDGLNCYLSLNRSAIAAMWMRFQSSGSGGGNGDGGVWDHSLEMALVRMLELCQNEEVPNLFMNIIIYRLAESRSPELRTSCLNLGKLLIARFPSVFSNFDIEYPAIRRFSDAKCALPELQELALRLLRVTNIQNIETFLYALMDANFLNSDDDEMEEFEHHFISAMHRTLAIRMLKFVRIEEQDMKHEETWMVSV
jgi:hypothetical protein